MTRNTTRISSGNTTLTASKHFAYVARRRDKYVIVLDGREIGNYSGAVGGSRLTFGQDAALTAFMNHGDEIFRVEVPVGRNPE